jgi:hypothetical protein
MHAMTHVTANQLLMGPAHAAAHPCCCLPGSAYSASHLGMHATSKCVDPTCCLQTIPHPQHAQENSANAAIM